MNHCSSHDSEFIAFCTTCKSSLCVDCLIEHPQAFKDHTYDKITKLREKLLAELDKGVKVLKDKETHADLMKQKYGVSGAGAKGATLNYDEILQESLSKLEKVKGDIMKLVESHFDNLRKEYKAIITDIKRECLGESASDAGKTPLQIVENCVQQLSAKTKPGELLPIIKEVYEKNVLDLVKSKDGGEEKKKETANQEPPKINFTEIYLSKLRDLLTQTISLTYDGEALKKRFTVNKIEKNKKPILPWFIENTNKLVTYEIPSKNVTNTEIHNYLVPFNHRAVCTDSNHFYLLGGVNPENGKILADVSLYDAQSNSMKKKGPMKAAKFAFATCYYNFTEESIYIIGGKAEKERLNTIEKYSPKEDTWKLLAKMGSPRTGGSACCTKEKLFIFGGLIDSDRISPSIEVYNIAKNICESLNIKNASCFTPCIDSCSFFINESLVLILGGARKDPADIYFTNNRSFYNIEQNVILENGGFVEDFPHFFLGSQTAVFNKEIYTLAKLRRESRNYGPFEHAIIILDLDKNVWKYEPLIEL